MDEMYNKINQLLKENNELKRRITELESKLNNRNLEVENMYLKSKIEALENKSIPRTDETDKLKLKIIELENKIIEKEEYNTTFKSTLKNIRDYATGLLGYKIEFLDNQIILHSMYAFDRDDVFIFQKNSDQKMDLLNNDFANQWHKEVNLHLVKNGSIPAFLASVTLELYNKQTFN